MTRRMLQWSVLRIMRFLAAAGLVLSACSSLTNRATGQSEVWHTEARVQVIDGRTWVVGTYLVTVSPDVTTVGNPSVGATVQVSGQRIQNGELVIDHMEVIQEPTATTQASAQAEAPSFAPSQPSTPSQPPPPASPPGRARRRTGAAGATDQHWRVLAVDRSRFMQRAYRISRRRRWSIMLLEHHEVERFLIHTLISRSSSGLRSCSRRLPCTSPTPKHRTRTRTSRLTEIASVRSQSSRARRRWRPVGHGNATRGWPVRGRLLVQTSHVAPENQTASVADGVKALKLVWELSACTTPRCIIPAETDRPRTLRPCDGGLSTNVGARSRVVLGAFDHGLQPSPHPRSEPRGDRDHRAEPLIKVQGQFISCWLIEIRCEAVVGGGRLAAVAEPRDVPEQPFRARSWVPQTEGFHDLWTKKIAPKPSKRDRAPAGTGRGRQRLDAVARPDYAPSSGMNRAESMAYDHMKRGERSATATGNSFTGSSFCDRRPDHHPVRAQGTRRQPGCGFRAIHLRHYRRTGRALPSERAGNPSSPGSACNPRWKGTL